MIKLENLTKAFETPAGTVVAADRQAGGAPLQAFVLSDR